jgi:hypothetical protein
MPKWALVAYGLQALLVIFLLMIALGIFIKPAAGPFVFGVTALLLLSFFTYLVLLEIMLRGHVEMKKHK